MVEAKRFTGFGPTPNVAPVKRGFSKMGEALSHQRPPPCKPGQSFPERFFPVREYCINKQVLRFLHRRPPALSECVLLRLQHTLQRLAMIWEHLPYLMQDESLLGGAAPRGSGVRKNAGARSVHSGGYSKSLRALRVRSTGQPLRQPLKNPSRAWIGSGSA